jgi:hypothetical protein
MEQNFQTSFIPKKPLTEERVVHSRPVSIFTIFSIIAFFTVIMVYGGLYFYQGTLVSKIGKMENDLKVIKNRFEPEKITQLQELDKRLNGANQILSNHIAVSPIFESLQNLTLKTIRFTKFTYTLGSVSGSENVDVKMSGQAVGYRSIALQSDLFNQHKKEIIDPVFSNLSLDNKGNVIFDLEFGVDPSLLNYKQLILSTTSNVPDSTPVVPPVPPSSQ